MLEEIVNAIGIPPKNTEAMVCTPDGDTESFPVIVGLVQGVTLAYFIFIIALDYAGMRLYIIKR